MGLFTLFACSDEALTLDQEKQSENPEIPMSTYSDDISIDYMSPFFGFFSVEYIEHVVHNKFPEEVFVKAHFGFAYYDGADDGTHFIQDLANSQTPTLYLNNSTEYLNTVHSGSVKIGAGTKQSNATVRTPVYYDSQKLSFPTDVSYGGSADWQGEETEIMHQYGKLYFIDFEVPSIGFSTRIKVKFGDDSMDYNQLSSLSTDWALVGGNMTGINGDLVYNIDTKEICLANNSAGTGLNSEDSFIYNGETWYVRAYTKLDGVFIDIVQ